MKYQAFISYSHQDEKVASRLHRELEGYKVPKAIRGTGKRTLSPIFRDRTELIASHSLSDEINHAIVESRFLIVLCSPAAKHSQWVNQEIQLFRKIHGDASILCAILEGSPETSFPEVLVENNREPLAADISKGNFRLGVNQLAASMLGVGLDEIVQRDMQRLRRRVMTITATAAVIVVSMASLTWTAVASQALAEQRRDDAEQLIEFMITNLKDELEEAGSLDPLIAVGDQASAYYDDYPLASHNDDALGRRSKVFHMLGQTLDKLGNLEEARKYFDRAFDATQALLARSPDDPERIFEHSQSVYWRGYMQYNLQDYDKAKEFFETYQNMSFRLNMVEGDTLRTLQELSYSYTNLGSIAISQGRLDDALALHTEAQSYKEAILEKSPSDVDLAISIADTYGYLADIDLFKDNVTGAISHWTRAAATLDQLNIESEKNAKLAYIQLSQKRALTILHILNNDRRLAIANLQAGYELADWLMRIEPDNVDAQFENILLHFVEFDLAYVNGDLAGAVSAHKVIDAKIQALPPEFRNDYRYEVLERINTLVELYVLTATGNERGFRQAITAAKTKLEIADLETALAARQRPHILTMMVLIDAALADTELSDVLRDICENPDGQLGYQKKMTLAAHFGISSCPNAMSDTPYARSSTETALTYIRNMNRKENSHNGGNIVQP